MEYNLADISPVPVHVAIIMDGNGRWAQERNEPRLFGHKAGVNSVKNVVETAREIGIRFLTLYAFSTENWRRPKFEVTGLMELLRMYLMSELDNLLKNNIRLKSIGQNERLPNEARKVLDMAIEKTTANSSMTLNLALSYGGRNEIIRGVRELARRCSLGELDYRTLTEEMLTDSLDTTGQPDPDLLIRTGGESRLSNFLLWQASYTELYFTDIMWPDFGRDQFLEALRIFRKRQRRFGKTGAQTLKE